MMEGMSTGRVKSVSRLGDLAMPRPSRTGAKMAERDAESHEAVSVAQRPSKADPGDVGFLRRAARRLVEKDGDRVFCGHIP